MSNPNDFIIKNGVLTKYKGAGGDVVIPEGVKEIGVYAFVGSGISTITLPESLENVTENCFSGHKTLRLVRVKKWNPAISLLFRKFNVEKIVAEDFSSLPAKYRPAGALGFITEKTSEPDSETDKTVTDYLRKNAGKLLRTRAWAWPLP